jgi:hypothetical protein
MADEKPSKKEAKDAPAVAELPPQPPVPLPPIIASPIPQVDSPETDPESGIDAGAAPKDEEHTDGIFEKDGEKYALCIHDPDIYGNTHSLKNSRHFWQGKEPEFNAKFKKS